MSGAIIGYMLAVSGWQEQSCKSPHCECSGIDRAHCHAKLMDRHRSIEVLDVRSAARRLAAACAAASSGASEALTAQMSGPGPQFKQHQYGGVEQRGPVRGVLPVLSQGWRLNEEPRQAESGRGPAQVHAVARRCCELAGCARGKCLACLATRQRNRSGGCVPGPSDLVQQEAAAAVVRHIVGMDWKSIRRAVPQVDWVWLPGAVVSQAPR